MMNPDTNRMEPLIESALGELVRPDGTPVPKNWSIFKTGEKFDLNGYTFKLAHIGESYIVLEPVGIPVIGGEDVLKTAANRAKRDRRKKRGARK